MEVFKRVDSTYKVYLNPASDYIEQVANIMSIKHKISLEEAKALVKECILSKKPKNPIVKYNQRNRYGDIEVCEGKLLNYIKEVKEEKNILVPSFTSYLNHDKMLSIHGIYIQGNKEKRSKNKKTAFKAKLMGDQETFAFYDTSQQKNKIDNNSLSGAYGSNGTILFNESAHYTLTSMTRCVSGIGNIISESIVGGNRLFLDPDSIYSYMACVLKYVDMDLLEKVINKYQLVYPDPMSVFTAFKDSFRWYWKSDLEETKLFTFISKLRPIDRAAILYVNDMWSVKNLNDMFTRNLIGGISLKSTTLSDNPLEDLKEIIPGTDILLKHIYAEEIKGRIINYEEMVKNNERLVYEMAGTARKINETLSYHEDFFKCLFLTDVIPPNLSYLSDMMRTNIVLSDTDSTCCSYDKWVYWYYGGNINNVNRNECIGIAGGIMTITTQLIRHNLRIFTGNMNVSEKYANNISMKNEYFWPVFVTSNKTKHYFASVMIREGNVYKELEREKKGVHFIASTADKQITSLVNELMDYITETVRVGSKVSMRHMCGKVADMERQILKDFELNNPYMFRKDTLKDAKAYKNNPEESKYLNHIFWKDVFRDKYGVLQDPPYTVYNIPLNVNNKTEFKEMIEYIKSKDIGIGERFEEFARKYNKDTISTIRIPKPILDRFGIPEEIKSYVDIRKTIRLSCFSLYEILTTIGFYKKETDLVMDLDI